MSASEPAGYGVLESRIGYTFRDRTLCESALTHKSWLNERHGATRTDNERLEFLGDAVLALAVSDMLMKRFPDRSEGELSKTRAALVSEVGLAKAAEGMGLGEWIFLGRGEDQAGGRRKPSILSDALEALVGAVYLDGGFTAAHDVTERLFAEALRDADSSVRFDFKSRLQERSQALLQATPQYTRRRPGGPRPRPPLPGGDPARRPRVRARAGPLEEGGRAERRGPGARCARPRCAAAPGTVTVDRDRDRRRLAAASPPTWSRSAGACATPATRRTWSAAASATCCSGARPPTSTSRPTRAPKRCCRSSARRSRSRPACSTAR